MATSFNQQLGGAWSTSTAWKDNMFRNCPGGSIEGKTNNENGTPDDPEVLNMEYEKFREQMAALTADSDDEEAAAAAAAEDADESY